MALTVTRLKGDNLPMRNVIIAKEAWYLTEDKTRAVKEGDPEGRVLLVGKGGEIDENVANAYGIQTEEKVEVARVSQSAYEEFQKNIGFATGQGIQEFDKQEMLKQVAEKVAEIPTNDATGVTGIQRAMLTEGLVNHEISRRDAEQPTQEAQSLSETIKEPETGEGDKTGLAEKKPANKRSKTIGKTETTNPEDDKGKETGEDDNNESETDKDPDKDTGNGEPKTQDLKTE